MADIQLEKLNLDFLIRDCLEAYTEETLDFEIPSHARSATDQRDETADTSFGFPELEHIFNFTSTEEVSPITPEEASEGPLGTETPFTCNVCGKPYRGNRQLKRHMKKHSSADKFSCTIEGCEKTSYRTDAMRSHIKAHERRLNIGRRTDQELYINV
jgi:uncharacterized Zn-finger protein